MGGADAIAKATAVLYSGGRSRGVATRRELAVLDVKRGIYCGPFASSEAVTVQMNIDTALGVTKRVIVDSFFFLDDRLIVPREG